MNRVYSQIFIAVLILLFFSCSKKKTEPDTKIPAPWNTMHTQIDPSNWSVRASIHPGDTAHVLGMVYRGEMWTIDTALCMVVFVNDVTHEYKLVAPWIKGDMVIQKNNLLSDQVLTLAKKN